ncbi:DUF680 domain-containing protein [Bradyrhizobium sp. Arg314]
MIDTSRTTSIKTSPPAEEKPTVQGSDRNLFGH